MKTILGQLVSVQPISLSKSSRYISDFASFESNGASEVVSIYLDRASQAFSSLVQLHKDIKHPQSSHKKDRKESYTDKERSSRNDEKMNCDVREKKNRGRYENQGELEDKRVATEDGDGSLRISGIEDMGTSKKKKKDKKEYVEIEDKSSGELRIGSENGGNVETDNMVNGYVDRTKKKKKKNENTRRLVLMGRDE